MMNFLISLNLPLLKALNQRLNNYMEAKDPLYNAIQWGKIIKHQSKNNYALDLGRSDDERNPFINLFNAEKLQLVDKLPDSWESESISL